jgi:PPM family protein phosphatase
VRVAWHAAGGTDVGRLRSGNEDALRADAERGLFLVADGMGGHAAGEVASALVAETVASLLRDACEAGIGGEGILEEFRRAVLAAHGRIGAYSAERPAARGMGTTLTACAIDPAGACRIAHIGDSRLYRMRAGELRQLTHDHTWVQREVDTGRLSPAAARRHPLSHILTRVLTDDAAEPEVDLLEEPIAPGDLLVLMTDGLYNMLDDPTIAGILSRDLPLRERIDALIEEANRAGGADNITAIVVEILPG